MHNIIHIHTWNNLLYRLRQVFKNLIKNFPLFYKFIMELTTSTMLALCLVPIFSLTYDVLKTPLKKNKQTNKYSRVVDKETF